MKYNHTVEKHNLKSPSEVVPKIFELVKPNSVVDVGCGLGSFLRIFKEQGANEILGIDGNWCKKELLFENIDEDEFLEKDLEKPVRINRKFDLAVSVEVAEHLSPGRASSFVQDLINLSDVILFSAAIPKQGGDHHYNEQWLDYWEEKFNVCGFKMYDVLRPVFWNNSNLLWWYKQNMVLFVKEGKVIEGLDSFPSNNIKRIVHPELFSTVMDYKDKNALKRYLKLLFKALFYKFGLRK